MVFPCDLELLLPGSGSFVSETAEIGAHNGHTTDRECLWSGVGLNHEIERIECYSIAIVQIP